MKTKTKTKIETLAVLAVLLAPALPALASPSPAPTTLANLYLSPASASVAPGENISVEIHENSGSDPVNIVRAGLTYPQDLLDFQSIDSSPAFNFNIKNYCGAGSVLLIRGAHPAVSGDQIIATVNFQAKAPSSSVPINFTSDSLVIDNNSTTITGTMTGAIYSIVAPSAPAPQPTPQPAPAKPTLKPTYSIPAPVKTTVPAQTPAPQNNLDTNFNIQPAAAGAPAPSRWPLIIPAVLAIALLVYHGPRRRPPQI